MIEEDQDRILKVRYARTYSTILCSFVGLSPDYCRHSSGLIQKVISIVELGEIKSHDSAQVRSEQMCPNKRSYRVS